MSFLGFLLAASAAAGSAWLLRRPAKFIVRILANSAVGFLALVLGNTLLSSLGVPGVGVNAVTSMTAGIMGFPGIVMLYALSMML